MLVPSPLSFWNHLIKINVRIFLYFRVRWCMVSGHIVTWGVNTALVTMNVDYHSSCIRLKLSVAFIGKFKFKTFSRMTRSQMTISRMTALTSTCMLSVLLMITQLKFSDVCLYAERHSALWLNAEWRSALGHLSEWHSP